MGAYAYYPEAKNTHKNGVFPKAKFPYPRSQWLSTKFELHKINYAPKQFYIYSLLAPFDLFWLFWNSLLCRLENKKTTTKPAKFKFFLKIILIAPSQEGASALRREFDMRVHWEFGKGSVLPVQKKTPTAGQATD